jgi:hypothetical protein
VANALADEAGRAVSGAGAAGAPGLRREAPTCGPGVAGRRGGQAGFERGASGRGQDAAWAGGTRVERPRRGSAEADRAGPRAGEGKGCGLGRSRVLGRGWKLGLGCYGFPPFFYFLIQTNSNQTNYLNSNFEFEFNPNTQTK